MRPSTANYEPKSTKSIKVPFTPPGTDKHCETAVFIYGDLDNDHGPLICVHGGPGAGSLLFVPFVEPLRKHGIPVVMYDQIGCADSTHLPETRGDTKFWTMELFHAELSNIIAHLGLDTYDLLGHSWGGMIAGSFALTQPKGMRKLIEYSTAAAVSLREVASRQQRDKLPSNLRDALVKGEMEDNMNTAECKAAWNEFNRRHMCRINPWPQLMIDTMKLCEDDDAVTATLWCGTNFHHTGPIKDFDLRPDLANITDETVPGGILVMNGQYDSAPDDCNEPYAKLPKAAKRWVRFEQSSHVAHLEEPERFFEVLSTFLLDE